MRAKTSPTRKFAISIRPWVVAAAFSFLVGTACTDQPEASDQGAGSAAAADPGAKAKALPQQEQARTPLDAGAESTARSGAQDPEPRQRRFDKLREDRYAELGLSDEQQQSIEALRAEQQAWIAEHRGEISALANRRKAARQAGDEAEVEATRLQLRELRDTRPTERDIVALLTDEQRAQLRKNRAITLKGRSPGRQAPSAQADDTAPPSS